MRMVVSGAIRHRAHARRSQMSRLLLLIVLTMVCSALTAPCAVIRVPDDEPTISAGVAAASAGDTVLVASGTYHESSIWMKDGVCLTSETGQADCVTIDAQFQGKVFYCQTIGSESSIVGFTMTVAHGAILCRDGASPTIRNCVFTAILVRPRSSRTVHLWGTSASTGAR
jgi:hypothetical protein